MITLKNISKKYFSNSTEIEILKNINLNFRDREFVSILGESGSGKTTLLNIIGGLDKYTDGDLVILGKSTKNFKDKEWDSYRNGTIGFVFQSYNLIPHLSVLENVRLALSISGISSKESIEKAKKSLQEVGLQDHIYKKPSQLSGGQMQRVAIARALVTDPKIILADEPTGALDSKTSVQVMELIKKISKDKLVLMVTHNPKLAKEYSDRIISIADGQVLEDTNEYLEGEVENTYESKSTSMSFGEAIKSSFKNLLTKKIRTTMTTIAGSIGIISIGLVLSLSDGMNEYINKMQDENLSSMPITISATQTSLQRGFRSGENSESTGDKVIAKSNSEIHKNLYTENVLDNEGTFIDYIKNNASSYYKSINFSDGYQIKAAIKKDTEVKEIKIDGDNSFSSQNIFSELPATEDIITSQYELAYSSSDFTYPLKSDELILFVDKDNSVDKKVLSALGIYGDLNFKEIVGKEISFLTNNYYYGEKEGRFYPNVLNEEAYNNGKRAKIVAVFRAKDNLTRVRENIGYTKELSEELQNIDKESKIVVAQKDKKVSVISNEALTDENYTAFMQRIGGDSTPTSISIYPKTFNDRDSIVTVISDYNQKIANKYGADTSDYEKYSITYSDYAKQVTSILSQMITTITLILTAFAAISLIVSSIMIGILTYVSVVERTKEIGILRAIGARKKDITRIFMTEAGLIGLMSGGIGVIIAIMLNIPVSKVVGNVLDVSGFSSSLSLKYAILLIVLSIVLTLISSIIPSKKAAKKNPVESLRSE